MRTSLVAAFGLLSMVWTGCVSAFPASSLDTGRDAAALPQGGTRLQVGGGGGAAPLSLAFGGGAGLRLEHQVLDELSWSLDAGSGLQTLAALPFIVPFGSYLGAQWNPGGLDWFALRGRAGVGVDSAALAILSVLGGNPEGWAGLAPYLSFAAQAVLSLRLPATVSLYLVPGLGAKQFLGGGDVSAAWIGAVARTFCRPTSVLLDATCGTVDTLIFPGVTTGLQLRPSDNLSFYASANFTGGVIFGRSFFGVETRSEVLFSPSANVQLGAAVVF